MFQPSFTSYNSEADTTDISLPLIVKPTKRQVLDWNFENPIVPVSEFSRHHIVI